MKLFQKLVCMALTATATASLSICAFAADYTFDTAADTDYYPSTSYEDTYGTAYHYGSKNLVDYQIPELPYGVLSTTQTGVMEKLRLPGLQQTVGGSATGIYGVDSGVGIPAVTPVIPSYQEPAYTSAKDMERKDGSIGTLKIPSLDINIHNNSEQSGGAFHAVYYCDYKKPRTQSMGQRPRRGDCTSGQHLLRGTLYLFWNRPHGGQ